MPEHIGHIEQQRLHQLQVIGGADDELAAAPPVLLSAVPPQQGLKGVHAQVMLYQVGNSTAVVPAYVRQQVGRPGGGDQNHGPGRQRSVVGRDRVVYDTLGYQRNQNGDDGAGQRRPESQQQIAPKPHDIAGQPPPAIRAHSPYPFSFSAPITRWLN
ncbi:Uncharacterised protein [Mycobacterium tuberculosis]|nr:Uncharacterised protein [Mycobacterium tuberculosis]COV67368.1 Uncharacterised protein [Mycobacterium tuberculosis]